MTSDSQHLGGCRPLRNKTVTVPGPNGAECHSVIEQCACAGSCYRTSYMETVYDYVDTDEPLVKEIDVGRCVGSCSGADTRKCVFRDKKTPGKCIAGLYGKQTSCTPSQFKVHRYSDKEKRTKEVISITACKCLNIYTKMYFDSNVVIDWLILLLLIATPLRCDGLQRFEDSQEQEGLVGQEDDLTTHRLDQQSPQLISSREKNNREKALAKLQEEGRRLNLEEVYPHLRGIPMATADNRVRDS
uniref:Uncharacterized protein n=1 Tax=Timema shepardi TaxID=629360 RepID=A0A7R9ANA5_TIMSH|nr:unnamed protein product [Timema shepardi]